MRDDENDFDALESLAGMDDAEAIGSWQVYFLSLVDPADPGRDFGLVKVGITRKDVERRIEQLQTGLSSVRRLAATKRRLISRYHRSSSSAVPLERRAARENVEVAEGRVCLQCVESSLYAP